MTFKTYLLILICPFLLTSCFEIFEKLVIHDNGSGSLQLLLNFNMSKNKIQSILAMDSLDGKKIPSLSEIKTKVAHLKQSLEQDENFENVEITENYESFIFKIKLDFRDINQISNSIESILKSEKIKTNGVEAFFSLSKSGNIIERNISYNFNLLSKYSNMVGINFIGDSKIKSVVIFDNEIKTFSTNKYIITENKSVMTNALKTEDLLNNNQLLNFKIQTRQ